jgi:hypothetical protein
MKFAAGSGFIREVRLADLAARLRGGNEPQKRTAAAKNEAGRERRVHQERHLPEMLKRP